MSFASAAVVFIILWWIVFFMILPIGVRAQEEGEDGVVPGTPESAPEKPRIWWKILATTVIAAVLFALYYGAVTYGWLSGLMG